MKRRVQASMPGATERLVILDGSPDLCPQCHHRLVPKLLVSVALGETSSDGVEEAYQCTNRECLRIFIASYVPDSLKSSVLEIAGVQPIAFEGPVVPETVSTVSPTFVNIYTQALSAESHNLDQIAGLGLRKALEFLVKDFAIQMNPQAADTIRETALQKCITKYFAGEPNLQVTAKRATWLGNDEAHYTRLWSDKDISDLKVLIRVTVNWVENVLLTRKYEEEMPGS